MTRIVVKKTQKLYDWLFWAVSCLSHLITPPHTHTHTSWSIYVVSLIICHNEPSSFCLHAENFGNSTTCLDKSEQTCHSVPDESAICHMIGLHRSSGCWGICIWNKHQGARGIVEELSVGLCTQGIWLCHSLHRIHDLWR